MFGLLFGDVSGSGAIVLAGRTLVQSAYSRQAEADADAFASSVMRGLGRSRSAARRIPAAPHRAAERRARRDARLASVEPGSFGRFEERRCAGERSGASRRKRMARVEEHLRQRRLSEASRESNARPVIQPSLAASGRPQLALQLSSRNPPSRRFKKNLLCVAIRFPLRVVLGDVETEGERGHGRPNPSF